MQDIFGDKWVNRDAGEHIFSGEWSKPAESPTVTSLQAHNAELKELLETLAEAHVPQEDGTFVGLYATRLNVALGRV